MIAYYADSVKRPAQCNRATSAWIKQVAAGYGKKIGELAYMFCNDAKMLEVNVQYLQHDYYTDIITFDYSEGHCLNGDMYISLDTVRSNAEQFGCSYEEELYRVMIHGVLHLCGLKDKSPEEAAAMRAAEHSALQGMFSTK